jgi:oligosaccharide repeat unit polymerase
MSRERWRILLLCLLYCAVHMLAYLTVILPWFFYRGYRLFIPNLPYVALVAPLLLLPALFLPVTTKKISDMAPWVLYATLYVPGVYIPLLTVKRDPNEIIWLSVLHFVGLVCFELLRRVRVNVKFTKTQNSSWLPGVVVPIIAILIAISFWRTVDFKLDLSWETLYERRFAARDLVGPGQPLGYLNQIFIKVFIPALALFAWLWKSGKLAAACIFCCLISWAFDANKLVLFTPVLIFGIMLIYRSKHPIRFMLVSLTVMIAVFIPVRYLMPAGTGVAAEIAESTIKRALYEPGLLTGYYWDHFTIYPLNNFGGSPFAAFFTSSPYEGIISRRIGYMYFGNDAETANAGIMAGAISDMGPIGVPIIMAIAGFTLRVFECLGEQRNRALGFSFIFVIAQDWSNRPFQTSLITGGVLASFLLLWLYSDPKRAASSSEVVVGGAPVLES